MVAHGLAAPPRRMARLLRIQLRQELQLRYVGSVAGVYWSVINPLVQVAVYVILVTFILKANIPATRAASSTTRSSSSPECVPGSRSRTG